MKPEFPQDEEESKSGPHHKIRTCMPLRAIGFEPIAYTIPPGGDEARAQCPREKREWSSAVDSNDQPALYKNAALTIELAEDEEVVVGISGLEPLTSSLSGKCSNQLS